MPRTPPEHAEGDQLVQDEGDLEAAAHVSGRHMIRVHHADQDFPWRRLQHHAEAPVPSIMMLAAVRDGGDHVDGQVGARP